MLFVANGANNKPSLMCKYRQRVAGEETDTFVTQELVPGVETFQVLYGIKANDDDEVPDKFLTASAMSAADWPQVVTVKIAMVVRADNASADAGTPPTIRLFGTLYDGAGATFTPTVDTQAARRLYYATLQIRNYQSCLSEDPSCL
ncbi:hypothetical protein D3C87_1786330 [compost metagenome]